MPRESTPGASRFIGRSGARTFWETRYPHEVGPFSRLWPCLLLCTCEEPRTRQVVTPEGLRYGSEGGAGGAGNDSPPYVHLFAVASPQAGGSDLEVSFEARDLDTLAAIEAALFIDEVDVTGPVALATHARSFSLFLPEVGTAAARVRLRVTDALQARTIVDSNDFTIDASAPSVTVSWLSNSPSSDPTVAFSLSGCEPGAEIAVSLSAVPEAGWVPCDDMVHALSLPADGDYVVRIYARDALGNGPVEAGALTFTLDRVPPPAPELSLLSPALTSAALADVWVACSDGAVSVALESGAAPAVGASGAFHSCATLLFAMPLDFEGENAIIAWAEDAAGNRSPPSATLTVTRDTQLPDVTLQAFTGGERVKGDQSILWSSSDAHPSPTGATVEVSADGGQSWDALATGAPPVGTVPWPTPADGALYRVRVRVRDALGLEGSAESAANIIVDSAAPSMVSTHIVDEGADGYIGTVLARVQLSAEDAQAAAVRFRVKETTSGNCTLAEDAWGPLGGLSQEQSILLTAVDGPKKVCAWARDELGNTSLLSGAGIDNVDTDSITLQIGNPPRVTFFEVDRYDALAPNAPTGSRIIGPSDDVRVRWRISDVEGLSDNPITLAIAGPSGLVPIVEDYGGLSGNPQEYPPAGGDPFVYVWTPPGGFDRTAPFRLRIVAKDKSGTTSVPILSDVTNTPSWSVYAGNPDFGFGGSGVSAQVAPYCSGGTSSQFAIDPLTNDIYATDYLQGIVRLSAQTGIVERFIGYGTTNLPAGDSFAPILPSHVVYSVFLHFDRNGYLYVAPCALGTTTSAFIYQIDVGTKQSRRYLGGGLENGDGAALSSSNVHVLNADFAFDEDDRVYFLSSCEPGNWDGTAAIVDGDATTAFRLLAAGQDPATKLALAPVVVAGKCAGITEASDPIGPFPMDPMSQPLSGGSAPNIGNVVAWDHGDTIYYSFLQGKIFKIVSGQTWPATATLNGYRLARTHANGKLYAMADTLFEVTPNLAGSGGETTTLVVNGNGSGDCAAEEVLATNACGVITSVALGPSNSVFFADGVGVGRVRYLGLDGKLRTVLGTLPFYGVGLHRRVIRAALGGVAYNATQEGSWDLPGLYFTAPQAPVLARIGADDLAISLWGNQSRSANQLAGPASVSPSLTAGNTGYLTGLAFDDDSRLALRSDIYFFTIDRDGVLMRLNTGTSEWDEAADGADPSAEGLYPYGGYSNITLRGGTPSLQPAFFMLGGFNSLFTPVDNPVLKIFDFSSPTGVLKLMGNGAVAGFSADTTNPPSNITELSIDSLCMGAGGCFTSYDTAGDRLYFSERTRLRYLSPTTGAPTVLATLFNTAPYYITSFIFTPNKKQVYYVSTGGGPNTLRCHNLVPMADPDYRASCNDSALGPPTTFSLLDVGPNQLTWLDTTTLLVSDYTNTIYAYTVQP